MTASFKELSCSFARQTGIGNSCDKTEQAANWLWNLAG